MSFHRKAASASRVNTEGHFANLFCRYAKSLLTPVRTFKLHKNIPSIRKSGWP